MEVTELESPALTPREDTAAFPTLALEDGLEEGCELGCDEGTVVLIEVQPGDGC